MDDLVNNDDVDSFEGQPISPAEMGIQETTIGGGETVKPSDLSAELKDIFDPSFSTLAHGTRLEFAQEILDEGLRSKHPDLAFTTIPLFDSSKPYEDQAEQAVNQISHWPHLDAKAVVIVMIPNPQEGEQGGATYFNSVFQELPEPDTRENARYLIPPSYVKGYIDIETQRFIPNSKFQPEKPTVKNPEIVREIITDQVKTPTVSTSEDKSAEIW